MLSPASSVMVAVASASIGISDTIVSDIAVSDIAVSDTVVFGGLWGVVSCILAVVGRFSTMSTAVAVFPPRRFSTMSTAVTSS